jgi:hypothetical protein
MLSQVKFISNLDYLSNLDHSGPEAFLPDPISRQLSSEPIVRVRYPSKLSLVVVDLCH